MVALHGSPLFLAFFIGYEMATAKDIHEMPSSRDAGQNRPFKQELETNVAQENYSSLQNLVMHKQS